MPHKVSVATAKAGEDISYPEVAPFHPGEAYPEYPFKDAVGDEPNLAYALVRESLQRLGLDAENFGTPNWNPLGYLVKPGMRVVIKPNFVLSRHNEGGSLWSIITHPSMMRAVADYCYIAMGGKGTVEFADAPQYNCNFEELMEATRLREVAAFLDARDGFTCEALDLRNYWSPRRHQYSMLKYLKGDPRGSFTLNLGRESALCGKESRNFYGAVYQRQETISHHKDETHEYMLSKTHYDADVFISVPKLKVHKKVGVTLNAKGMVGTATNKNYLVHYTLQTPDKNGDQYPQGWLSPWETFCIKTERWMYDTFLARKSYLADYIHRSLYWLQIHTIGKKGLGLGMPGYKRVLDAGNWYGNDSAWRMTLDLLRAIYFGYEDGFDKGRKRKMFTVIDGLIGGDNRGPLEPDGNPSGVVLAGDDFLATDIVATRLMGYDPMKVRIYDQALKDPYFDFGLGSLDDIDVAAEDAAIRACLSDTESRFFDYLPHPGWIDQLEVDGTADGEIDYEATVKASLRRSSQMRKKGL